MIQKIQRMLLIAALAFGLAAPVAVPASVSAAENNTITRGLCKGSNDAAGTSGRCRRTGDGEGSLRSVAQKIVNIFSIIVGIVAVIMIIYGGFRYITSGGDSNNVSTAKNTLIYAIIGLIVVALAQFIVHYVLQTTTQAV
jgi:predicted permease